MLQYDWGNSDECLNFTHRATLGGGDDADAVSGSLQNIA
jgi:hypothetical protein